MTINNEQRFKKLYYLWFGCGFRHGLISSIFLDFLVHKLLVFPNETAVSSGHFEIEITGILTFVRKCTWQKGFTKVEHIYICLKKGLFQSFVPGIN